MRVNGSDLNSTVLPRDPPAEGTPRRPPWVTTTLAAILIFTIVVDLLGNLLVILSVYRNKKLRNAEISFTGAGRVTYCNAIYLRGGSDSRSPRQCLTTLVPWEIVRWTQYENSTGERSGRNRRYLLKKIYFSEDFLPSLQERTNRNKEYLTLYQKGGFGGGKHLASLSHSIK